MKAYVNETHFINEMTREGNGFSYEWAKLLFEYLEQYEEDTGCEIELDPVAIRCEFNEYCVWDYINDYKNVYIEFVDFLYNNNYINSDTYDKMYSDDIYKIWNKFDANKYDTDILSDFYNNIIVYDESFCNGKNYECFIVRNY